MTDSRRPAWPWVDAMVGVLTQTVVMIWVTISLAVDAARYKRESLDRGGFNGDGFLEGIGSVFVTVLAFVTGLTALALVLALALSARRGGTRLAGFIVAIVLLVPQVVVAVSTVASAEPGPVATLVAGALVLVGVVSPSTWRWSREPRAVPL